MMTKTEIARRYIHFLENAETDKIVKQFATDGKVNSPLYGVRSPKEFYALLADDTLSSKLTINSIFENNETNSLALYFTFDWTLTNNKKVIFDVVDIIEFNEANEITLLTIIYDTVIARGLHEDVKS